MSTLGIHSMSRTVDRASFTEKQRIQLLEGDNDKTDVAFEAMNARLGKILWLVVTLIVSTSTAALIGALNLVAGN